MSEQAKHVPGPWKFHLGRGANPRFHIQTTAGYQIAQTPSITPSLVLTADENASRESNARLIAAAPELLEALEGMLAWARRANLREPNPGPEIVNALNAINKATRL